MTIDSKSNSEISLQLKIRSSTESLDSLDKITTMVVENLRQELKLLLVEKNFSVNRTKEKKLTTVVVTLQSE